MVLKVDKQLMEMELTKADRRDGVKGRTIKRVMETAGPTAKKQSNPPPNMSKKVVFIVTTHK